MTDTEIGIWALTHLNFEHVPSIFIVNISFGH